MALVAFPAAEVKVLGSVEYGQPTALTHYTGRPRVQAFGFNARPGDQIEVSIESKITSLKAYLTDAKFQSLAGGNGHFSAVIPGPNPATYYIAITEPEAKPAEYTLDVERPSRH